MGADGSALLRQERYDRSHITNLDNFFLRLYVYFTDKGFVCSLVSRVLNLATLLFTIIFSGFLLLYVDWDALTEQVRAAAACL